MLLKVSSISSVDQLNAKFLRVGNEIYIIGPEDKVTYHIELARKEKILDRIEDQKTQNPDSIDGGLIFISGKMIRVGSASDSLSIPVTDQARKNTIQVLKKENPSFNIKELAEV